MLEGGEEIVQLLEMLFHLGLLLLHRGHDLRKAALQGHTEAQTALGVLLAGGNYRMGQIIGSSNAKGEVPVDQPYRPENVIATMYQHLGISPGATVTDLTGRPRFLLENRRVVKELL